MLLGGLHGLRLGDESTSTIVEPRANVNFIFQKIDDLSSGAARGDQACATGGIHGRYAPSAGVGAAFGRDCRSSCHAIEGGDSPMKRPSFQFYPSDWRNDGNLRLCSIAARGLLIDLMCIAHECDVYGVLAQNGHAFDHKTVGKLTGLRTDTAAKLTEELTRNRVLSYNENGALYSRRMVRDEDLRNIRAEAGAKGGNPHLVNQMVKQKPTPSSSSSSSSSNTSSNEEVDAPKKSDLPDEEFWTKMRLHYPDIDVEAEHRKMEAWLLARPRRKKTRPFVISWLNKVEPALAPAKVEEVEQW